MEVNRTHNCRKTLTMLTCWTCVRSTVSDSVVTLWTLNLSPCRDPEQTWWGCISTYMATMFLLDHYLIFGYHLILFKEHSRTEIRHQFYSNRVVNTWNNLPAPVMPVVCTDDSGFRQTVQRLTRAGPIIDQKSTSNKEDAT